MTAKKLLGYFLIASPFIALLVLVGLWSGLAGLIQASIAILVAVIIVGAILLGLKLIEDG